MTLKKLERVCNERKSNPDFIEIMFWRDQAHQSLDRLWKTGYMERSEAYALMKTMLGLGRKRNHIARLNINRCKKLIKYMEKYNYLLKQYKQ